jgi:hypothetical protein
LSGFGGEAASHGVDRLVPAVRCGCTATVVVTPSGDVGVLVLGGRRCDHRTATPGSTRLTLRGGSSSVK